MFRSRSPLPGLLLFLGFMAWITLSRAEEIKLFEHSTHLETELECAACHDVKVEGKPVLKEEVCSDCHDDGKPTYRFDGRARPLKSLFSHLAHQKGVRCETCHQAVLRGKQSPKEPMVTQSECATCHKKERAQVPEGLCTACHAQDYRRFRPPSHGTGWQTAHGPRSEWSRFASHGQVCDDCHERDACKNCHQASRPRNHTGLWRNRSHGLEASWDRESCKVCHETGSCTQCHRVTRPMNHTAAWKSTHGLAAQSVSNSSCAVCHSQNWCLTCHTGGGR